MDLKSSQLWGTPAIKTVPESGLPDIPALCPEATGTLTPVMQQRARKKLSASLLTGLSAQSGFYPKKKPEAQKLRLPNLEIPAQVLTPNFQIPGSLSTQLTGKQGAGTINFQKPQLRQKPLILDSQAQLCFKVI